MDSKSRKEKRKEARSGNNKQKHQSRLQHQESQRKRKLGDRKSNEGNGIKKKNSQTRFLEQNEIVQQASEHSNKANMVKGEEKGFKRTSKTKFEEYLEMEMPNAGMLAEQDIELERKLARKLKVKGGKLGGVDDGLDMLFEDDKYALESWTEGFPDDEDLLDPSSKKNKKKKIVEQVSEDEIGDDSSFAALDLEEDARMSSEDIPAKAQARKRRRKRKSLQQKQEGDMAGETACSGSQPAERHSEEVAVNGASAKAPEMDGNVKYVAPHLRSRAGNESEEHTQIRRRVRGLLNRLSESNVESITAEIASIFRSTSRSVSSEIISQEVLVSCYNGPRGNEQYAAVFAAFVAGMACSVGMDFSAKLIASLAKTFEEEYLKEDNLSLRNLTLLLSYLCIFGVCSSDLIYDFLIMLSKRLTEIDVSTILTILQCCGLKIRGDDPAMMKNFILTVQNRVNELRASSADGNAKINGKRMEFMLETICDIKNNKKKPKEDTVQHTRIKKWLQKLKAEDILSRGLKWSKLLDPEKKGQWWLSGDMISATDDVEEIANTIDKEAREAQKMLELAAAQRMNTDARRAIFCVIMSGEDYIDTFEKLLRLDLPGKQDRDIMRVLVECCLQEKVFNKYYTVLAAKLCEHEKNHKFTLQFCLWDNLKELDSMPLIRSMHLAKFIAEMVASFTLSLAVLKTVEWTDPKMLSPKRIMHFRMLFEAIFEYSDKLIWNMFTRIAVTPELETLRQGMEFFIKEYVVKTNKKVMNKFRVAKKALNNTEGVLM